jgi:hypothetical protein
MVPDRPGFYITDRFGNVLDGPYPDWDTAQAQRTNCGDEHELCIKRVGYEVTVEHIQTYFVTGAQTEEEAQESACRFAAGNEHLLPEGVSVEYGDMLRNEATECRLAIQE